MKFISVLLFTALTMSCSDTNDPDTETKADLNPPSGLKRIIGDASVNLYWKGNNPEKDFKGYYIFGTKTSWSDLRALIKFPSSQSTLSWDKSSGIPRCSDNNDFFAKFGLPATTTACEKSGVSGNSSSTSSSTESTEETTTSNEFKDIILQCNDQTGKTLSLEKGESYVTGNIQNCKVTQAYDPTTSALATIANGEAMSFIAVSVMGDDLTKISWTSNIVEASGSLKISKTLTLTKGQFNTLDFATIVSAGTITEGTAGTCSTTTTYCSIGKVNAETVTNSHPIIWISRDRSGAPGGTDSNAQRLLLSTSSTSTAMQLYPRGNEVYEPLDPGVISPRTPQYPVDTGYESGAVIPVAGLNVFDLKFTIDSKTYYGKFVITNISYSDTDAPTTSSATISYTVLYQKTPDILHYLR